jgi:hypothetical protein
MPAPPAGPSAAGAWLGAGQHVLQAAAQASLPGAAHARHAWLLAEALAEARAIVRMYLDPRYRLSWVGWLLPLVLLAAFFTSYYWVPFASVTVIGYLLNKLVDLLLAFVLFKVLTHEARRYRETAPDLPPTLRL